MPKQNGSVPATKTAPEKQASGDQKTVDGDHPALDPLVRNRTYPEPYNVFAFVPVDLTEALGNGLVAIDTNALVLPFGTGANSLKEIRSVYAQLAEQKKLRIPGQVAREFADIRATKLTTLYQQVQQKQNISEIESSAYPLLDGLRVYEEVRKAEREISSAIRSYRKNLG